MSVVIPFNPAAYTNPGLALPVEFLIGLLLTMGIRIAFAGLHMGGQLLSYHLGFSAVQAIDPQTQNRSTLMSSYLTMLGYVIILASDQHHVMFRALADSYKVFPIGASISTNQWFGPLMEALAADLRHRLEDRAPRIPRDVCSRGDCRVYCPHAAADQHDGSDGAVEDSGRAYRV